MKNTVFGIWRRVVTWTHFSSASCLLFDACTLQKPVRYCWLLY